MAKRKKYPKLPNGWGTIRYLGAGRRNPYAVHPPTKTFDVNGVPERPPALCYVDSWEIGSAVLVAYHAGKYYPGMELEICPKPAATENEILQRVLADYSTAKRTTVETPKPTFAEIYKQFYAYKFEREGARAYSKSSRYTVISAFKNCADLHDKIFAELGHDDLQGVVDRCEKSYSTKSNIIMLYHQMCAYADTRGLCDRDVSKHVKVETSNDVKHGEPFSERDLAILWQNQDDPTVEMILIMCYSGFRISAYKTLKIDLKEKYFLGGVKTTAGKGRIVPIHSSILKLVKRRKRRLGCLLPMSPHTFRGDMRAALADLGIPQHTPHDCRHTFSALCERYKVNENDRKRMIGHSFKGDITNGVYGHRTIEELREEIEKIEIVTNV